ncbi:MAG: hypothetical protein ACQEW9_18310 [Bacteroidota bacterium]
MKIPVEYLDRFGVTHHREESISKLGLIKHLSVAGMGQGNTFEKIRAFISVPLYFYSYLNLGALKKNKFSQPKKELYNPTTISQFSNLAGVAVADFLSKRIDKSIFTTTYEAVMRNEEKKINESRPDLIAYKANRERFAIEAKGFSNHFGKMKDHKDQSKKGPCSVNFSIASVIYNIYTSIKCKYHDPIGDDFEFSEADLTQLSLEYYLPFSEIVNFKVEKELVEFQDHQFFAISINSLSDYLGLSRILPIKLLNENLYLLLSVDQIGFRRGVTLDFSPFIQKKESESIYVDYDYIGIAKGSKIRSLRKKLDEFN